MCHVFLPVYARGGIHLTTIWFLVSNVIFQLLPERHCVLESLAKSGHDKAISNASTTKHAYLYTARNKLLTRDHIIREAGERISRLTEVEGQARKGIRLL